MIYFLQAPELSRVKIGTTTNLKDRLLRLRDGSPTELVLLATCAGGRTEELRLHKKFSRHRVFGEWFADCDEIQSFIDRISQADPEAQASILAESVNALPTISFDRGTERKEHNERLRAFIAKHGIEEFRRVSGLGAQMASLILKRQQAIVSPVRWFRLVAADPSLFDEFDKAFSDRLMIARAERHAA